MKRFIPALAAFGAGLLVITALLALSSDEPATTLAAFFAKPFSSWWYVGNTLNMAGLYLLAATGAAFAMRCGAFNLGGEAQLYAPALVTAIVLAARETVEGGGATSAVGPLATLSDPALLAVSLVAALAVAALLGLIPGILRARFRVNEMLVSFLLSAALIPVIDYLIGGPLRSPGSNLLATPTIARTLRIAPFLRPSYFNLSFPIAVAVALLAAFFLKRTGVGYRLTVTGRAPEFARYAGFPASVAPIAGMTVAAVCHGLAGWFAVTGTWYTCHQGMTSGMGWGALAIALIARQSPLAAIPASLLYAWLDAASATAVLSTRFSFDSTSFVQAVIFLVISATIVGVPGLKPAGAKK